MPVRNVVFYIALHIKGLVSPVSPGAEPPPEGWVGFEPWFSPERRGERAGHAPPFGAGVAVDRHVITIPLRLFL